MACEPFVCENCSQLHERCAADKIVCSVCRWSGGNVIEGAPCVKCGEVCIRRPCERWPSYGEDICYSHGGNAGQTVTARRRRQLETEAQRVLTERGWEKVTNPVEALSDLAGEIETFKDILRERVSRLREDEWTTTDDNSAVTIAALIGAYERALERSAKTLTDMVKLDLDARRLHIEVQLAQSQAERLHGAIEAAGRECGFAPEQLNAFFERLAGRLNGNGPAEAARAALAASDT